MRSSSKISRGLVKVNPCGRFSARAMVGVRDIAPTGKLVALLSVLTPALTVGLADDRAVAALGFADSAGGEDEVDRPQRVLHPVGMMLDAPGMEEEAGLGLPPPFRR